jgi:CRISPR-associated endonuclease/helicase Cas3
MVCDLAPWERMVQRLGRVNRRGDGNARIFVVHQDKPEPKKAEEPKSEELHAAVAWRSLKPLNRLPVNEHGHDVSPAALAALRSDFPDEIAMATTPEPLRPELTRALVDAWSMTSLKKLLRRFALLPCIGE